MDKFSKKDQELLFELSLNARSAMNKIAKKLKVSQQGLSYKLKKLEEKGTILHYYTLFDFACFGYHGYKVIFTLNRTKPEQVKQFREFLQTQSSVLSIEELSGHWDFLVFFATKNSSRCSKEIHELITQFPKLVKNYVILTNVVSYELQRKYLLESSAHVSIVAFAGDREPMTVDTMDRKLLSTLYENPRIKYSLLAAKYKLNPKTVINKIKALETKGIIKGYSTGIDCYKYGYFSQKIFLKLVNFSFEKEEEILKFCRQQKNIIKVSKLFGNWDLEMDLELNTIREFQDFCINLRINFGDIIKDLETCSVRKQHKLTSLPTSFFSE